jgi:hypothetical protein
LSENRRSDINALNGAGTVITVSPTQLNFGSQKVGTKSTPQNVTVTNTGTTTVSVSSVKVTGNESRDFPQTNTCGSQIDLARAPPSA